MALLIISTLSGCGTVLVKDHIIDVDKGSLGAFEAHTLTTTTRDVSKAEWDALRIGMLCMDVADFGDYKSDEEKFCSDIVSGCSYDTTEEIRKFNVAFSKMLKVARIAKAHKKELEVSQ